MSVAQGKSERRGAGSPKVSRLSPIGIKVGAESYLRSATTTNSPSTQQGKTKTSHSRTLPGGAVATNAFTASLADTVTVSDAVALAWGTSLAVSDTVTVSDAGTATNGNQLPLIEMVTVTDAQTLSQGQAVTLTETVTVSDALSPVVATTAGLADTVAVSDAVSALAGQGAGLADTVTASDAVDLVASGSLGVADTVTVADQAATQVSFDVSLADAVTVSDQASTGFDAHVLLVDTVTVSDGVSIVETAVDALADTITLADAVSVVTGSSVLLHDTVLVTDSVQLASLVLVPIGGEQIQVTFPDPLRVDRTPDASLFTLIAEDGGVPLVVLDASPSFTDVASGSGALLVSAPPSVSSFALQLPGQSLGPSRIGGYVHLDGYPPLRVEALLAPDTVRVDTPLFPLTPGNGTLPWRLTTAVTSILLTTNLSTRGKTYRLVVRGLRRTDGLPYEGQATFVSVAPLPTVTGVVQLPEGSLLVTFSGSMRGDKALTDPAEYRVTGPTTVEVLGVRTVSDVDVLLDVAGLGVGSYTLTVNATGTPKDSAGNPIDPAAHQAAFNAVVPLAVRSVFTDHGPIARPPLTLQTGTGTTLVDAVTLDLGGAGLTPSVVGRYLSLSGTARNDGDYRITSVQSGTRCKVAANLRLPDVGAPGATWTVYDPRDGEIADDPSHVQVRVNGTPVTVESVIGLLGQVVLTAAPGPADVVKVDYSWISDPQVSVQRLNSREFRLNNKAQLFPGGSGHVYAYRNVLLTPSDFSPAEVVQEGSGATVSGATVTLPGAKVLPSFVGLTLSLGGLNAGLPYRVTAIVSATSVTVSPAPLSSPAADWAFLDDQVVPLAQLDQPLQRDLKYRAYERAYTAALNDPGRLLLNTPLHKVAYPPLGRQLDESFVSYEPVALPEGNSLAPWTRKGLGTATLSGDRLVVEDTTTGPFPAGNPIFWVRPVDTTFPHVLAMTWQVEVPLVTATEGVWSGVAAGFAGPERALIVGFLNDGGILKVGVLRAGGGADPGQVSSWTGGLDGDNLPTLAPAVFDWSTLRSYRVLQGTDGVLRIYVDGSVVETLRVIPSDLPFLAELNDPFDQIQGVFFGSLSREAMSRSIWDFVRYTVLPSNPLQTAPSVFVTYEGNVPPEAASPLWTPVGYHGTETFLPSGAMLLDSTSATTASSSTAAGLIDGDFRGYLRLEPLLTMASDVVLDVAVQLRSHTQGPVPNAVMAAVDDGTRLMQLSLFADRAAPILGYGGRSLPTDWTPTPWSALGTAPAAMVGRTLRISDASTTDGRVYLVDDVALPGDDARVVGPGDYVAETRVRVVSSSPDPGGFAGVTLDVYDSTRFLGIMLQEVAGVRYVTFHSGGVPIAGGQVPFEWRDGAYHTYRIVKSTGGGLVSLFVDSVFLGTVSYASFVVPPASVVGMVSFGSATAASQLAQSVVDWSYVNTWKVWPSERRYAGLWNGGTTGTLRDFHLPLRASGEGAVGGNVLSDPGQNFVAQGAAAGDLLVVDVGPNAGVYEVTAVTATTIVVATIFPSQPSVVGYRLPRETDWTTPHRYRLVRSPTGEVTVILDSDPAPLLRVDLNELNFPPSSAGVPNVAAEGMASVSFGAFDPAALTQTSWAFVRYGMTRSPTELRIVPQGMVLNQRNVMASPEHVLTQLPHTHTDFWAGSDGIPPKQYPDFLTDPNLVAFTLLNEGTPLVPSTQTLEVRKLMPQTVFLSALNRPEDVLNTDGDFALNDGATKVEIVYPDDVLYTALDVIETQTGEASLLQPFCDCPGPTLEGVQYQKEVCLSYDGGTLPESDPSAPTPWQKVSDDDSQVTASVFGGILTYGTTGATRTVYRNATPLPDSPGLITEVSFRLKIVQDGTFGLGDSQIRLGMSAAPNVTAALAFLTSPLGERYVLLVDLHNAQVLGGIPFDWYDGGFHTYRLVRDPGQGLLSIFVDS